MLSDVALICLFLLHDANGGPDDRCVTKGCVLAAANLINSIDERAAPCQNFYGFACGKWKQDNPIPDDESMYMPLSLVYNRVNQRLRRLLEDDSDGKTTANSIRFAKALYKACVNIEPLDGIMILFHQVLSNNMNKLHAVIPFLQPLIQCWYYNFRTMCIERCCVKTTKVPQIPTVTGIKLSHLIFLGFFQLKINHNRIESSNEMEIELYQEQENEKSNDRKYNSMLHITEFMSIFWSEQFGFKVGGWPVVNSTWTDDQMDLTSLSILITRQFGVGILTPHYVDTDVKNNTNHILMINQVRPLLTKDYLLDDAKYSSKIAAYRDLYTGIVQLIASDMNVSISLGRIQANWMKLIKFEKQLAKIFFKKQDEEDQSRLHNAFNLKNFSALIDIVNWTQYFKGVFPGEVFKSTIGKKADKFVFYVQYPKHFEGLKLLLSSVAKETIFEYTIWRTVAVLTRLFDRRFTALYQKFDSEIIGRKVVQERWKLCSSSINKVKYVTGALYVRKYFSKEDKNHATDMVDNLKGSFKSILHQAKWMDRATKDQALSKLDYMIRLIGYPELLMSNSALDKYYKKLSFKENASYFELYHVLNNWINARNFHKLLESVDQHEFLESPAIVNAFYQPSGNSIMMPAAILQPPFFHHSYPKYINYGLMGAIIGHEITHGFDQIGHQYDKKGSLKNWWSESSKKNFEERTKCIRNQYGSYVESTVREHVDGNLTVGENIADNGGLKTALYAYDKFAKLKGNKEKRLPGLNLTIHQTFFASFAMFYCSNIRKETIQLFLKTDTHSPNEIRVNGAVSNSPMFAKAYGCPKGSPMNPERKCSVW